MDDLTRRDVIKLGAAATVAATLNAGEALAQTARAAPAFLSAEQFALLDELSEMIIPTDDRSPGAKTAKVAAFIDARLAESWDDNTKKLWREGLPLVDRLSQQMNGKPFLQSAVEQRTAVLTRMAQNEATPVKPEEIFFGELKARVVHAYYTSEIGIKQDMEYKGNRYLQEFVGTDVSR